MFLEDCNVLENLNIADDYYLLRIKSAKAFNYTKPGQFYMLKCGRYLRRPISVHFVNENILEFYYQVKGAGTKYISELKSGSFINIQGPLGNGFSTNIKNKNLLILSGGVGIAPMRFLIDKLRGYNKVSFIAGFNKRSGAKIISNFDLDRLDSYIATDDGSIGLKGSAIDRMVELFKEKETLGIKFDKIYICGPKVMIEKSLKISLENKIDTEVSLEEKMACGVNACLGCSVKTNYLMKKVCYDGPVFDGNVILD